MNTRWICKVDQDNLFQPSVLSTADQFLIISLSFDNNDVTGDVMMNYKSISSGV